MKKVVAFLSAFTIACGVAHAAPQIALTGSANPFATLPILPSAADMINAQVGTQISGGFHPANTVPADQIPAFTDGAGLAGLAGLLADFPGAGVPAWSGFWTFGGAQNVGEIRIFSGNAGNDGRVFHNVDIFTTTDPVPSAGGTWTPLMQQVRPAAFGAVNTGGAIQGTLTVVNNNGGAGTFLVTGATGIRFDFFSVSNTALRFDDPYTGVNPITLADDGSAAAFESPLLLEVDVFNSFITPPTPSVQDWSMF